MGGLVEFCAMIADHLGLPPLRIQNPVVSVRDADGLHSIQADPLHRCVPWGILLVDQSARILFANPRARAFLTVGAGLEESGGRVRAERASVDRSLTQLVRWATSENTDNGGSSGSKIVGIPSRESDIRFVVRVVPCGEEQPGAALVIIADLSRSSRVDSETAKRVFSLSEREGEFAELFAAGHRLETIAERMGVAINTARVHLRHVCAKVGCTSQIELARTLASIP